MLFLLTFRTLTFVSTSFGLFTHSVIQAWIWIASVTKVLAITARISFLAKAGMTTFQCCTHTSILTGFMLTKIHFHFAMSAHVALFAIAHVIVDQLNTVQCSNVVTWIWQTLINVSFASRPHKTWWTSTFKSANFIYACTIVMTCSKYTIIYIDVANYSECS